MDSKHYLLETPAGILCNPNHKFWVSHISNNIIPLLHVELANLDPLDNSFTIQYARLQGKLECFESIVTEYETQEQTNGN